jgi:hypothetical protein
VRLGFAEGEGGRLYSVVAGLGIDHPSADGQDWVVGGFAPSDLGCRGDSGAA